MLDEIVGWNEILETAMRNEIDSMRLSMKFVSNGQWKISMRQTRKIGSSTIHFLFSMMISSPYFVLMECHDLRIQKLEKNWITPLLLTRINEE